MGSRRATHPRDTRDWDNWVQRHYKRLVDAEKEKEEEDGALDESTVLDVEEDEDASDG
ncbi:hypothetical protein T492DRAFT_860923 [Pavlovales sp. CCMP2436]|nr:hypothetical protein T492DRAFT_860923 [Pavlovales sp. CCMP2436]